MDDFELEIDLDDIIIEEDKKEKVLYEKVYDGTLESKQNNAIEKVMQKSMLMDRDNNITTNQMIAIDMYIKGSKKSDIAKECGVSNSTISKWFNKDDKFLQVLDSTKKEIEIANKNHFNSLVPDAISRLKDIIINEPPESKTLLGAIKIVMENSSINDTKEITKNISQTQIVINPKYEQNDMVKDLGNINDNAIDVSYKES
ncbi:MAG: hypothetical protein R3Y60_02000 [bacterium]